MTSCHLVTTRLSWRAIPRVTVAAFASCPSSLPSWRSGPLPGVAPAGQGRGVADGRVGARAGALRRWCQPGTARLCAPPLRRRIAPWRSPARLPTRHVRNQAPRRTGTLGGGRPSGFPLRALTPPMPGSGRWRRSAARLALCRSLAAIPVSTSGNCNCLKTGREHTHIADSARFISRQARWCRKYAR